MLLFWARGGLAQETAPNDVLSFPSGGPRLSALGLTLNVGSAHPGLRETSAGPGVAWVVRWGRLRLSNGGPLASPTPDASERGLAAELAQRGRLRLTASLGREQGRQSSDTAALRGLSDIPAHWRGTVRAAWEFQPGWDVSAAWTAALPPHRGAQRLSLTLAHAIALPQDSRWSLTTGASLTWRNAISARAAYGVDAQDALRTGYPVHDPGAGWTEAGVFLTARRPVAEHWLAYGTLATHTLLGAAAQAPWVQQDHTLTVRLGFGRLF